MLNGAGRVNAHFARIFIFCVGTHSATSSLRRGRVRMTAQLLGNKFPQFARMLTLLARTFGTGEIPDRWYSPRTPKGSRTGETY